MQVLCSFVSQAHSPCNLCQAHVGCIHQIAYDGPAVGEAFTTACINSCSHVAVAGRSHTLEYVNIYIYIYVCIPQVDADIYMHRCIHTYIHVYIYVYVYYNGVCDTIEWGLNDWKLQCMGRKGLELSFEVCFNCCGERQFDVAPLLRAFL